MQAPPICVYLCPSVVHPDQNLALLKNLFRVFGL